MKFQYLGSGALEGVPAMLCDCETCRRARAAGGRSLRTRSQAIIDDRLLIDFPPDTCVHAMAHNVPLHRVRACIVTHSHHDHLYPDDMELRRACYANPRPERPMDCYATAPGAQLMREAVQHYKLEDGVDVSVHCIEPFVPFSAEGYEIVPLKAAHDPASGPVIYLIRDQSVCILYGNDTGWFPEETWDYLREHKPHFDFVSLDCTFGLAEKKITAPHMGLSADRKVMEELRSLGCADADTKVGLTHISHLCLATHEELAAAAAELGFLAAYDGMTLEI